MTKSRKDIKLLITTPDYLPKIGGLSTYTKNIEICLNQLGMPYDVFVWNNLKEAREVSKRNFSHLINIHSNPVLFLTNLQLEKTINIFHGSEILFHSPVFYKKIAKALFKNKFINKVQKSKYNIFISKFTQNIIVDKGLTLDYSRDLILHNCIDTSSFLKKDKIIDFDNKIVLCSVARDVPHKNLDDVVKFSEIISEKTKKEVILYITSDRLKSSKIKIISIKNATPKKIQEIYSQSQFNLLFSKDHSRKGFIEGFGLSCLEAGLYKTPSIVFKSGGLPENIHHKKNGIVIDNIKDKKNINLFLNYLNERKYHQISTYSQQHTMQSHNLALFQKLLKAVIYE